MDWIRVHLVINHLPVMGFPVVAIFLFIGLFKKNDFLIKTAMLVLLGVALSVGAVFLTGDEAEERAELLSGYNEVLVHQHEDAAKYALIFGLLTAAVSAVGLATAKNPKMFKVMPKVTFGLALFTTSVLAMTAHHGGKMRHGENPGQMGYQYPNLSPSAIPQELNRDETYKLYHPSENSPEKAQDPEHH